MAESFDRGLAQLAQRVRDEQAVELADNRRRVSVRNRLLARPPERSGWKLWAGAGSAAMVVAGAALLAWLPTDAEPLTFKAGSANRSVGQFLTAPGTKALDVTFSDGSRIDLLPQSNARVARVSKRGASLRLEQGTALVHVVHRPNTEWSIQTGPYTVHVVGTRFSVSWDAQTQRFELAMAEGAVRVEGPDGRTRTLRTGERVLWEDPKLAGHGPEADQVEFDMAEQAAAEEVAAEARVELPEVDATEMAGPQEAPSSGATTLDTSQARRARGRANTSRASRLMGRVRRLTARARYAAAIGLLSEAQTEDLMATGSASDLATLARAARHARDPRTARLYKALYLRFAASRVGSGAAFELGRYEFHRGNLVEAERWLAIYVAEQPRGRWTREALGRLLEVHARTQRNAEARRLAERYLKRYPQGPHRDFARALVVP